MHHYALETPRFKSFANCSFSLAAAPRPYGMYSTGTYRQVATRPACGEQPLKWRENSRVREIDCYFLSVTPSDNWICICAWEATCLEEGSGGGGREGQREQ